MTKGPFVVRRARSLPRDLRAVSDLLLEAGITARRVSFERLGADLSPGSELAVILAERRSEALGIAVVRFLRAPGEPTPARALLEHVYVRTAVRRQGIGTALVEAVTVEAEAAGARVTEVSFGVSDAGARSFLRSSGFAHTTERAVFEYLPPAPEKAHGTEGDPSPVARAGGETPSLRIAPRVAPGVEILSPSEEGLNLRAPRVELSEGVFARYSPLAPEPTRTFWSGAMAFRTRLRADCRSGQWTTEGCIGTEGDEGDALRFDPRTRRLREAYFARPRGVHIDAERLLRLGGLSAERGVLVLSPESDVLVLERTVASLFDLGLEVFVALTARGLSAGLGEGSAPEWKALELSPELSVLFLEDRYAGWRVIGPVRLARPMGWPEVREAPEREGALRSRFSELLYDWMTIDASEKLRPDEASDPEEIAHMVAVRDRARALSAMSVEDNDPAPEVARDIAAHIHWSWGFFRISE